MENTNFLCSLREFELERALSSFPAPNKEKGRLSVLEIGAGIGHQATLLSRRGYDVVAIDVRQSAYRNQRVYPVVEFDGRSLPIATGSIAIVFSSNVLEHIRDIDNFLDEIDRVVALGGIVIHILPTSGWRLWTILGHYVWLVKKLVSFLKRSDSKRAKVALQESLRMPSRLVGILFPRRHGERGTALTEIYYYSHWWWKRKFQAHHWQLSASYPTGLFYTGAGILGDCLPLSLRQGLARWLGSACRVYALRRL